MTDGFTIAATAFVFCGVMSAFYWWVLKPVFARRYLYRLFELRDRLRWGLIEGSLENENEHVQMLERMLDATIANSPHMSFFSFIVFCIRKRNEAMPEEIIKFHTEAPETVRRLSDSMARTTQVILLINSPVILLWFLLMSVVSAVVKPLGASLKKFIARKTDVFIAEEMPYRSAAT